MVDTANISPRRTATGSRLRSLAEIRADLVTAHRARDWEWAKELSQEKVRTIRRTYSLCLDCGVRVKRGTDRCLMHSIRFRWYRTALAEKGKS